MKQGLKAFLKEEWAKIKLMTFKEKRWYIWEYYKWHLAFFAFFVFLVHGMLNVWVFNPTPENYFYIAWLGSPVQFEQLHRLSEHLEEIVEDPERQTVLVTSYARSPLAQENHAIQTRFFAMMQLGELSMFLSERDGLIELSEQGFVRPVTDFLDYLIYSRSPLYHTLQDRLTTITFSLDESFHESPEEITEIMAISVSDSPLLEYLGIANQGLYASIVVNSHKHHEMAKALEVLLR